MLDFVNEHPSLSFVGWSLLCAAAIIGLSVAFENAGYPEPWMWILPVWWIGFTLAMGRQK